MAQEANFDFKMPPQFEKITQNIRLLIIGFIVVAAAFSSVFTVETEEVGVITRFGEYVSEARPGLNFKIPFR